MSTQLTFLICSIFVASCTALSSEFPKKIVVTRRNQHEFGLPIGTVLRKDRRTGRYIPPSISEDFTPEARLEIQFNNKVTARNFCRVGDPAVVDPSVTNKLHDGDQFCRSSDGEDLCCGKRRCSCNAITNNCACSKKIRVHDSLLHPRYMLGTLERLLNPPGFFPDDGY